MATPIFWTNVGVDVQTALSTAQTVTGITKANPGVLTYSGADTFANGDYVLLTISGMYQLNDRILRVANVNTAANTFELEGEDTSLYDTFVSGSVQLITWGASFDTIQNVSPSGGDFEFADTTTIHDNVRKRAPVITSPMSFSMDSLFDLSGTAMQEVIKAYKNKSKRAIRFRFGSGAKMVFDGYVGASGVPTGQAQGVVQTKVQIEAQNVPTVYST